jgi:hypothetical protein
LAALQVSTSFFDTFWPSLAAGVLVLALGYIAIDRLLGLRERVRDEARTRHAVLQIVHGELLHNGSEVTTWREELPTMGIPFPGFELGGWQLVSQMDALLTLSPKTADCLVHAYNRMRSCNEQLTTLRDLVSGASALAVALRVADSVRDDGTNPPPIDAFLAEYRQLKIDLRDGLLRRVDDLEPYLNDAIDAVEHEIQIAAPVPAAQRRFRHTKPPDIIGDGRSH